MEEGNTGGGDHGDHRKVCLPHSPNAKHWIGGLSKDTLLALEKLSVGDEQTGWSSTVGLVLLQRHELVGHVF